MTTSEDEESQSTSDDQKPTTSYAESYQESLSDTFVSTVLAKEYISTRPRDVRRLRRPNVSNTQTHPHCPILSPLNRHFGLWTAIWVMVIFVISGAGAGPPNPIDEPDPSILATFRDVYDGKEVELEKMIMDRSTNRLYIGGVNHLYDISPDALAIREHAITGPRPDSVLCADVLTSCKEPLSPTNSYTKALAIYPDSNKLIECTSLYQGRCRTRNLSNIRRESDIRSSRPGIVANDQTSSTVIFLGSGPGSTPAFLTPAALTSSMSNPPQPTSTPRVLYVGSTYVPVTLGPRDALDVPAVSSLSLESNRLFELTSQSVSSGTYMKLDYRRIPSFRIEYVGGFEANGFAYFATRQPKYVPSEGQPIISKLVRVCTQDPNFYSYTEAPLECMRNGVNYNLVQDIHLDHPGFDLAQSLKIKPTELVLFAVFSRGEGPEKNMTTRDSALCVYTIKQIETKFFDNIRVCYNGNTRTNLPWFNSDKMCVATRYPDSEIMCGKDVNSYIGGEIPIVSMASLVDHTSLFTSVTADTTQAATVAFIGTASGTLHKALVEGHDTKSGSKVVKSIQLTPDGSPLLQDMELDEKNGLLYVMSRSTTSACTTSDVCDADAINPKIDWLNYKSGHCPYIKSIEPREQQITTSRTLSVNIENAPQTSGDLYCSFQFPNQQKINVSATSKENEVICATPSRTSLRSFGADPNTQSVVASLSVVKALDNSIVASTNFTFYDCHQLRTCTECASSRFPCDWCTISAKCVPNAEDVCQGEALINSVSRLGPSSRRGPDFCPRFSSEGDIYVASGKKKRISVLAHNLQDQMTNFKCQYTVEQEQKTHEKLATRRGDRIMCEEMLFEYANLGGLGNGTAVARFDIVWSTAGAPLTTHRLDNVGGQSKLNVIIYKCAQLAPNCGLCLGLDTQNFECGWCDEDLRCSHPESCPGGWLTKGSGTPVCPHPRIDDFYPKKGPINGGTKITITGVNLGLTFADIRESVRVASAKCDVIESEYVSSTRIVCHTRAPSTRQKQGQHVVFKLRDDRKYTAVSSQTFTYANPVITSFQPFRGPRSGGTDLTILGADLDSGSSFNLTIGNIPCQVIHRTSSTVVCRTGPAPFERPEHLILTADGTQIKVDNVQFQYTSNPIIDRVQRPTSIVSGGIAVDVFGKGLDLLQRPRMVVNHEGDLYYGAKCEIIDEHMMVCRTPALEGVSPDRRRTFTAERPLRVDYGFDLDGTLTGNLTIERAFPKLAYFDDPTVHHFSGVQTIRPATGGDLVIKGTNLNLAATQRDVRVTVDGKSCNVTALASSTLTCLLPLTEDLGDDNLDVVIYVGDKMEKVGEVTQSSPNVASSWLIAAFAIAFLGVFLALLLFVIIYRRKSTSHNRQMRYLKNQMNSIEMRVAQECKEAFHELQTNMNAIAGSLPQGASFIPFLTYQDYAARILFPHAYNNHPVLRELTVDQDRGPQVELGLRQLHRLLQNRTFLLSFVRTIDENKYLLLKDRVYVGSLLMVILQERMEYCTDILKQLLKELIRRNVESKFQPKILFRRAESVAERMLSAWFSFLMYKFLRRSAGKELYQLYWATRQQTEKGPQDALTMDARYSLSEEKLLRATIEFRELTVFVISDSSPSICDTQVRVLDCDSISQVKEKCLDAKYKTTAFSERPSPNDVDLELRTPTHRVLLQDLDGTSRCENAVWRYNTLAHYKVENKATLALLPRHATSSTYNLSSIMSDARSEKSSISGPLHNSTNSPTLNRPFGMNGYATGSTVSHGHHKHDPHGSSTLRVYHLVRPAADHGPQDNQDKMVTEIYLTRLLTMKGTLQRFIEELLLMIFSTTNGVCPMPPAVKYMFDFLDDQAREHGIVDPEVVHAWKSNALPLRFWVNLIKNPDFIFDIQKPNKIEGSLNVVAQTLMDACSTQENILTKDSPSSKLLFANEIDKYKSWVHRYYDEIRLMPSITDHEMNMLLAEESRDHAQDFLIYSALNELYTYINQNKEMIFEELNQKLLDTMEVVPDTVIVNNGSLDNYNSKSRLMANSRFY
ncbi:plexin cytoplasmic rasGAP domain-containing protein [Ditylenchus destructor]|uniref:Plexin cytoplasmic rasGAP domain-containing protein n=1 Tax=Ditylenchus destructor TaxID=166010 RepID=A0AAD4N5R6_9BILA|nr:plexin cytoplasmic rasGAP domain-containing protein [Ditylenchus destructor]